ncbi:tripartite tricarboxylate transporter TctB family protein [Chelativorans sp. AA-79]|uniref:tripartite tricarboxylate transporter TctB family protein n=1 Tax=Chelativorans sp. AA-79 TaxID=3028735 RepID=UPI0023F7EEA9|nr:tripartite tricarboxylate transporter TctB family protein [Chelativorans sp. AA-79]WEX08094.1 tripartite tricarboxylate transporter TctB family protein [Chelativorans sp. AA-79]
MSFNRKDFATGAIFAVFALIYGFMSLTTMQVGTPVRMGPGFFPAMLSGVLLLIALFLMARSFLRTAETPFGEIAWRAIIFLTIAIVVFAATAESLGMLPGTFVAGLISSAASRTMTPPKALAVAAGIGVFCTLVFTVGLHVPLPIFGSWFGG